ncbi:hypothetical protein T07_10112 [Trichinella nelsoni]|uniref:Uncharacterized protein n=1 Tax=Trichinella nelsoni TaxID=6336 RepID=A0A0V0RAM0_9BILA|nr:hypothetical protein T07_10112 [Trichinella nelsoni]
MEALFPLDNERSLKFKKKQTLATGNIFPSIKRISDKCFRDTPA